MWTNMSGYPIKFDKTRPQDTVVKIKFNAKNSKDNGDYWSKTAYYVQSCKKYVVHYQGNPKLGVIMDGLAMEVSEDVEEALQIESKQRKHSVGKMKKGDNTNNLEHDKEMADTVSESADDLGVINFAKARPFRTYSPKECLNVKQARLLMIAAKDESQGLLKASRATINYPAGGEVYVFTLEGLATDNWRRHLLKDTLSWAPKSNLTKFDAATNIEKTVYACKLDQTFKRLVYHDKLTGKVLVHYKGDGSKIKRKPHGAEESYESPQKDWIG
jgi:hypothetical protein